MSWASDYLIKQAIGNRAARRLMTIFSSKAPAERMPFLRRIGLGSEAASLPPAAKLKPGQPITMAAGMPIGRPATDDYRRYLQSRLPQTAAGNVDAGNVQTTHIHNLMNTAIHSRFDPWARNVRGLQGRLAEQRLRRHPMAFIGPKGSDSAFVLGLPVPPRYKPMYIGGAEARNPATITHEFNEMYGAKNMPGPFPSQSKGVTYRQGEASTSPFKRLLSRVPFVNLTTDQHRGFDVPLRDFYRDASGMYPASGLGTSFNLVRHKLGVPISAPEGGRAWARAIRRADARLPREIVPIGRTGQPILNAEYAKRLAIAKKMKPGDIPVQLPGSYNWSIGERIRQRVPLALGASALGFGGVAAAQALEND